MYNIHYTRLLTVHLSCTTFPYRIRLRLLEEENGLEIHKKKNRKLFWQIAYHCKINLKDHEKVFQQNLLWILIFVTIQIIAIQSSGVNIEIKYKSISINNIDIKEAKCKVGKSCVEKSFTHKKTKQYKECINVEKHDFVPIK